MSNRAHIYVTKARGIIRRWRVHVHDSLSTEPDVHFPVKVLAVAYAVHVAKGMEAEGRGCSLYIAGRDGQYQQERTYPRSSDPPETPG